jgi:hypothetical protein
VPPPTRARPPLGSALRRHDRPGGGRPGGRPASASGGSSTASSRVRACAGGLDADRRVELVRLRREERRIGPGRHGRRSLLRRRYGGSSRSSSARQPARRLPPACPRESDRVPVTATLPYTPAAMRGRRGWRGVSLGLTVARVPDALAAPETFRRVLPRGRRGTLLVGRRALAAREPEPGREGRRPFARLPVLDAAPAPGLSAGSRLRRCMTRSNLAIADARAGIPEVEYVVEIFSSPPGRSRVRGVLLAGGGSSWGPRRGRARSRPRPSSRGLRLRVYGVLNDGGAGEPNSDGSYIPDRHPLMIPLTGRPTARLSLECSVGGSGHHRR